MEEIIIGPQATTSEDRWCPTCSRWRKKSMFKVLVAALGRLTRDCMQCEETRAKNRARIEKAREMAGVDIDRIHYKLGAVKRRK